MSNPVCPLCHNPFEAYAELGKDKITVWIHEYPSLEKCKALKFQMDFVKAIKTRRKAINKLIIREENVKRRKFGNSRKAHYE